ncbi:MAG: FliM/FliN family flagellar motor switch protein [Phycisphaerae bacterium]
MSDANQAVEEKQDQQQNSEQDSQKTQVQNVDLPEASDSPSGSPLGSIDILLDMNVPVTVMIGQTEIPVKRLLQMAPGSVIQLNKPIDAPADLYLKDTKFATGTVVVVEDRFAIRINQILGVAAAAASVKKS